MKMMMTTTTTMTMMKKQSYGQMTQMQHQPSPPFSLSQIYNFEIPPLGNRKKDWEMNAANDFFFFFWASGGGAGFSLEGSLRAFIRGKVFGWKGEETRGNRNYKGRFLLGGIFVFLFGMVYFFIQRLSFN